MKKYISKSLFILCALILLNNNHIYASPFDEDSIIGKIKEGVVDGYDTVKTKAGKVKDTVVDKAIDIKDDLVDKAKDVKDSIVDKAKDVKDGIVDKAKDVKEGIVDKAKSLKDKFKEKANKVKEVVVEKYGNVTDKINSHFNKDKIPSYVSEAIFLPGHESKEMICQGIAYLPDEVMDATQQGDGNYYRYVLLSYYPKESEQPSQIVVIDRKTGKPIKRFPLYKKNGKPYTGHAGGITVAGKYVWVSSSRTLYGFSTQEILDFIADNKTKAQAEEGIPDSLDVLPAKDLTVVDYYDVDSKASCVSFDGKYIWVADFAKGIGKEYSPIKHHKIMGRNCWIAGYLVDSDGYPTSKVEYKYTEDGSEETAHKPDAVIAMRDFVQGMAFCDDYVTLSVSMGPINSRLAVYKNPMEKDGKKITYKPEGCKESFTVEAWELSSLKNWKKTKTVSAGSEDLEFDGKNLYVAFEVSSKNYHKTWININPTIKTTKYFYIIDFDKMMD